MFLQTADLLTASFQALPGPALIIDAAHSICHANPAWMAFDDCESAKPQKPDHATGAFVAGRLGCSADEAHQIDIGLRQVFADGKAFEHAYVCQRSEQRKWMAISISCFAVSDDRYALITLREDKLAKAALDDLKDNEITGALWAALVRSTKDAVLTYDLDGKVTTWNDAAEALYGYTATDMIGQSLEVLYPADWPLTIQSYRDKILAGELVHFEAVRISKSGTPRNVAITGAPVTSASGTVLAISNIHRDVTEMRRAEEARALVAKEAVHRSKNLMAVVIAIQREIARSSPSIKDLTTRFSERIASLSKSTDLLIQEDYGRISISRLIAAQIQLFDQSAISAIRTDGPEVVLEAPATETLGMAIFELLTNACKHGALTVDQGAVDLRWHVENTSEGQQLCVVWAETGMKNLLEPSHNGFGSTILKRLAGAKLGGDAKMEFRDTGLEWSLSIGDQFFSVPR